MNEKQQEREKRFVDNLAFQLKPSNDTMEAIRLFRKEIKSFLQSEIDLALAEERKRVVEMAIKAIDENISMSQHRHRIGAHSDDYGGESDYLCNCDEKERQITKSTLESLKIKISLLKDPVEGIQVNKK